MDERKMLTRQEIFDKVCAGLAAQGFRQSGIDRGWKAMRCMYRAPDGLKCAAGHLIDDEHYSEDMEDGTPGNVHHLGPGHRRDQRVRINAALVASGVAFEHLDLVRECQTIHDEEGTDPDRMRRTLHKLATRHGLTVPACLQDPA